MLLQTPKADRLELSTDALGQIQLLLHELKPPAVAAITPPLLPGASTLSSSRPKHIMISYAWKANKPLVIALTLELRRRGYEVARRRSLLLLWLETVSLRHARVSLS